MSGVNPVFELMLKLSTTSVNWIGLVLYVQRPGTKLLLRYLRLLNCLLSSSFANKSDCWSPCIPLVTFM